MPSSEPKHVSTLAKHKAAAREYQATQGLNRPTQSEPNRPTQSEPNRPTQSEPNHTVDSENQLRLMQQLQHTVASMQAKLDSLSRDNSILQATCDRQRDQLDKYRKCDEAMNSLVAMNPFVKPKQVSDLETTIVDVFAPPTKKTKRKSVGDLHLVAKHSHTVPVEEDVQPGDIVVARMGRRRVYRLYADENCRKTVYKWTKDDIEQTMPTQRVQFKVEGIVDARSGFCRARVSVIAPELHQLTQGVYFLEHGSYIEVGNAQHAYVKTLMGTGEVETCVVRKERLQHVFNFSIERNGEMVPCHYPPCAEYVEPQNRVRFCIAKALKSPPGRMEFIGYYDETNTFQPVLGNVSVYDMVPLRDALGENSGVTRFGRRVGASTQCV